MNWFYTVPLENSYSLLISIAYALIFFGAGSYYFWQTKKLKIPGRALSPLGILLVPLIFYSLQLKLNSEESKPPEYLKYVDEIIKDLPRSISKEEILFVGDALSTDIACALQANVTPVWMSQYSVDEVIFGDVGPKILKTENCLTLLDLLKRRA